MFKWPVLSSRFFIWRAQLCLWFVESKTHSAQQEKEAVFNMQQPAPNCPRGELKRMTLGPVDLKQLHPTKTNRQTDGPHFTPNHLLAFVWVWWGIWKLYSQAWQLKLCCLAIGQYWSDQSVRCLKLAGMESVTLDKDKGACYIPVTLFPKVGLGCSVPFPYMVNRTVSIKMTS